MQTVAILGSMWAIIISQTIAAKTLGDVRQCFHDTGKKCFEDCQDKIGENIRSDAVKCVNDERTERQEALKTCMTKGGITDDKECFALSTPKRLRRDTAASLSGIKEFNEAKECIKKCMAGTKVKCTIGCTAKIDDKTSGTLKGCELTSNKERKNKLNECLKVALAGAH